MSDQKDILLLIWFKNLLSVRKVEAINVNSKGVVG